MNKLQINTRRISKPREILFLMLLRPARLESDGAQELPVTLGGAVVTFNGSPAALLYVSPMQINALVPAGVAPGKVEVGGASKWGEQQSVYHYRQGCPARGIRTAEPGWQRVLRKSGISRRLPPHCSLSLYGNLPMRAFC
jgi:hypothetical protein